jgi:hydrogenase maturation protease
MKTLVLGLGNTILSDDGVGIHVANYIKNRCIDTDVLEASAAGFRVVDEMIGYNKLILIDSIITGKNAPGTLRKLEFEDFNKTAHNTSPHDISLFDAFRIVKEQNYPLPEEIVIYAVEVEDVETLSEQCTEKVQKAIQGISEQIIKENELS